MKPPLIAVLVRAQDGAFQPMVIGERPNVTIYRLTGCAVRPIVGNGLAPVARSIADLAGAVFVFVNAQIETLNHLCLDVLADYALRPDCGLVLATVWDANRRPLEYETEDGISSHVFAVRREHLLRAGGLAAVSAYRIDQILQRFTDMARADGLTVIRASNAVASLPPRLNGQRLTQSPQHSATTPYRTPPSD